jgi:hypothetical protein
MNTKFQLQSQIHSSVNEFANKLAGQIAKNTLALFEKMTDQEIERILPDGKVDLSARILILAACENIVSDQIEVESAIEPAKAAKRILKKNRV